MKIWQNREFSKLWVGQAISEMGSRAVWTPQDIDYIHHDPRIDGLHLGVSRWLHLAHAAPAGNVAVVG